MSRSRCQVLTTCALLCASPLALSTSCRGQDPLDRVSVRMKWIINGSTSEWFYGRDQGFFRSAKFKLEIRSGGPGITGVQLVASGASTFAVTSPEEVIQARANGTRVRAIAAVFQANPVRFLVAQSSNISDPAGFAGRTVALVVGDNSELQFEALLEGAGVRRDHVKTVPWSFDLRHFISERIHIIPAYAFDQPLQLRRLDPSFKFSELDPGQFGVVAAGDVLITSERLIQERPGLVLRFVRAFMQSLSEAETNQHDAVQALVTANRDLVYEHELETWKRACDFIVAQNAKLGQLDRSKWVATLERLERFQDLVPPEDFSIDQCFTNDFVDQIDAQD